MPTQKCINCRILHTLRLGCRLQAKDIANLEMDPEKTDFLDLPPELRNRIYELSLVQGRSINPVHLEDQRQPAITRTCHQIRKETLPIYYSQNHFILTRCCYNCNYGNARDHIGYSCSITKARPADWIKAMGCENLQHISRIRLSCLLHTCPHYFSISLLQRSSGSGLEIDTSPNHPGILGKEGELWMPKTVRELLGAGYSDRNEAFKCNPSTLKRIMAALCIVHHVADCRPSHFKEY